MKKNWNEYRNLFKSKNFVGSVAGGLGLALSLAACGSSNPMISPILPASGTNSLVTASGCPAGFFSIANRPCQTGVFDQVCQDDGGVAINLSGNDVCQSVISGGGGEYVYEGYSISTGVVVKANDQVKITFTSSSTGMVSYSGNPFNPTNDCSGSSLELEASDGYNEFVVTSGTQFSVTNYGQLQIGAVATGGTTGCLQANITNISINRCEDAFGNSYACP